MWICDVWGVLLLFPHMITAIAQTLICRVEWSDEPNTDSFGQHERLLPLSVWLHRDVLFIHDSLVESWCGEQVLMTFLLLYRLFVHDIPVEDMIWIKSLYDSVYGEPLDEVVSRSLTRCPTVTGKGCVRHVFLCTQMGQQLKQFIGLATTVNQFAMLIQSV